VFNHPNPMAPTAVIYGINNHAPFVFFSINQGKIIRPKNRFEK
jgi:hypothetical protein